MGRIVDPGSIRQIWSHCASRKAAYAPVFLLKDIEAYRVVENPWYYGWGIRFTPRGWLFNVSGFSAIELQMKNGKLFRIGTDDPEGFAQAIDEALNDALIH